jgi:hypothetical protein
MATKCQNWSVIIKLYFKISIKIKENYNFMLKLIVKISEQITWKTLGLTLWKRLSENSIHFSNKNFIRKESIMYKKIWENLRGQ